MYRCVPADFSFEQFLQFNPIEDFEDLDTFDFTKKIHELKINKGGEILVSYDVSSLFTNVPLDETTEILVNRAFSNNWYNTTHNLALTRTDLVDLLNVATKGQLFQFNGALYEQTDGVAMGSPLGPLLLSKRRHVIHRRYP